MALHLMPVSFYPDTSPRGFQPGASSYQTMLPESWGERGWGGLGMMRDPGPGVWGREHSWESLWSLSLQEKPPTLPRYSRLEKGPPHLESQVERATKRTFSLGE